MEKKNKKINWKMEIVIAVFIAVLIFVVMIIYADSKCEARMKQTGYAKHCEEKGMEYSYLITYPDSSSVKIGCSRGKNMGFEEFDLENFTLT